MIWLNKLRNRKRKLFWYGNPRISKTNESYISSNIVNTCFTPNNNLLLENANNCSQFLLMSTSMSRILLGILEINLGNQSIIQTKFASMKTCAQNTNTSYECYWNCRLWRQLDKICSREFDSFSPIWYLGKVLTVIYLRSRCSLINPLNPTDVPVPRVWFHHLPNHVTITCARYMRSKLYTST